jgi:Sec-independent protein translocase protein TatA
MFRNFIVSAILFLGSTSLVLIQTQQPARADFLDDLSSFLKGAEIGADLVNGIDRATNPDGSVDLGKAVKATQRAVGQFREATSDAPQPVMESLSSDEVEASFTEPNDVELSSPEEIGQNPVEEDVSSEEAIPDASEYDASVDQAEVEPE